MAIVRGWKWRNRFLKGCRPGNSIPIQWKATHPRIVEQQILTLMGSWGLGVGDTKLGGKRRGMDLERTERRRLTMINTHLMKLSTN